MRRFGAGWWIVAFAAGLLLVHTRRLITLEFDQHYDERVGPPRFNVYLDGRRGWWVTEPRCTRTAPPAEFVGQHTCRGSMLIPRRGPHTIGVSATDGFRETARDSVTTP